MYELASAITAQSVLESLDDVPVLHFTLNRRGGAFTGTAPSNDWVDLTHLAQELGKTECRYNLTKREAMGNKLVRKAKADNTGGRESNALMGAIATNGSWYAHFRHPRHGEHIRLTITVATRYANLEIGDPPQQIEMDLNMLASDFYVIATSSRRGNKFDDYFSKSHGRLYSTARGL